MKTAEILLAVFLITTGACTKKSNELGSIANPIKLLFVPSVDAKVIEDNSKNFKEYLEKKTNYKFEIIIPQSVSATIEAFGAGQADVAAINTLGYSIAFEKYGAQARLTFIRNGSATYQSEFIARADGKIKTIQDLAGKKVAFVEAASTSGYLMPLKTLKDKGIEPKETVFVGKHDNVVRMVYEKKVDAGATFYSPPSKEATVGERFEDARRLVLTQYPDVEKKVIIISLSDPIMNDPIIFRKEMADDMKLKIEQALLAFIETAEGKESFKAIYGVTGLKKANDADYEPARKLLKNLGKDAALVD
ncbi:MAG: phosphate/phosphite/phosphonate ABC transporter substrate-binding protein [Bdellovibrionaceae bacterium]|nr:phosphate/phosphite/phosphonate ABC transporter substrate-binding protein [Bdellovibrio sp.]